MSELELPEGRDVEIEFIDPEKPNQRGLMPGAFDDSRSGAWLYELRVPEALGFADEFRVDVVQKWLNLRTVAELRLLPEGTIRADLERQRALHEEVRQRMQQR